MAIHWFVQWGRRLFVVVSALTVFGCATMEELASVAGPSYPDPETEAICTNSWTGRLDIEDGGGFERYDAVVDFRYDHTASEVISTVTLTLQEARGQSKHVGKEGGVTIWTLSGPLSIGTRSLKLTEQSKEDPNDYLGTWIQQATLTFNPEWNSFNGQLFYNNGNEVRGERFVARVANQG